MRPFVLLLGAAAAFVEAILAAGATYLLGRIIAGFGMSMGTMSPGAGRTALWVLGGLLGLVLVLVAGSLAVAAVRGRPFGRPTRVAIVALLVVQGLIGLALLVTGSPLATLGVLVVFACLLLALVNEPVPVRAVQPPAPVQPES